MRTLLSLSMLTLLPASALAGPAQTADSAPAAARPAQSQPLLVTTSAFRANQEIPPKFTCEGGGTSPELAWSNVPSGTQSVAVVVTDPDAGRGAVTHWLITGLSPSTSKLPEGGALPQGATAAKNSKGTAGYSAPCPPSGRHRYIFRVFALDTQLQPPTDQNALAQEMAGHILAEGEVVGTYQKITPP